MGKMLRLSSWDKRGVIYQFSLDNPCLRRTSPDPVSQPEGVVKFFPIGGYLAIFKNEGKWFIGFDRDVLSIKSEQLAFRNRGILCFNSLDLIVDGKRRKHYMGISWSGLWGKVDPTYDELERETSDFVYYLYKRRKE